MLYFGLFGGGGLVRGGTLGLVGGSVGRPGITVAAELGTSIAAVLATAAIANAKIEKSFIGNLPHLQTGYTLPRPGSS